MKKPTRTKLGLSKETIRALVATELGRVDGGISAFNCGTALACPTKTCPSYAPCNAASRDAAAC